MSYSVGLTEEPEELLPPPPSTRCEGGFVVTPYAGVASCWRYCPPTWKQRNLGGVRYCDEPSDKPYLLAGCPGQYELFNRKMGYRYCSAYCPPGWVKYADEANIQHCDQPVHAATTGVRKALAAAAAGVLLVGSAVYYAWG